MKKFRVLIEGRNFRLTSEGVPKCFGFYTTRFVEALDKGEAEQRAVEAFREEGHFRGQLLNDQSDPPMLFAEEVSEIDSFDDIETMRPGLALYEDKPTAN